MGLAAAVAFGLRPAATWAHEGPPRILLEPPTVNPGGTVVVRGEDLPVDDLVSLSIAGAGASILLDSELTDGEGHFVQAIVIPYEIAEGTYRIEATGTAGAVVAAELVVFGSPIVPGEGGGGRDEDDPLLIPLPSNWQQSLSEPSVTAPPVTGTGGGAVNVPLDAVVLLGVVTFLAGAVVATLLGRRRHSA